MDIGTQQKDFKGERNRRSPFRRSLLAAGIFGSLCLASCGGGTNGSAGLSAGVYSSGASGGATATAAAPISGSTTTATIDATLYYQSDGTITLVDLTNMLTCTGTGATLSGSTLSGTLTCVGSQGTFTKVSFTGTISGSTISGSYTITGQSAQTFTIGFSNVTSQPAVSIDSQTFSVPATGCTTNGSAFGVWNGEMVMCPASGTSISIGSSGNITGGTLKFTPPNLPAQTIATNCTLSITNFSQTITFTGGTITPLTGLTNVYSVSNMTGTESASMDFTLSSGCSSTIKSSFPASMSISGSTFTMTSGTASVVDMNGTHVLVVGGSVSVPAQTVNGVSQPASTFSVPNTAL